MHFCNVRIIIDLWLVYKNTYTVNRVLNENQYSFDNRGCATGTFCDLSGSFDKLAL